MHSKWYLCHELNKLSLSGSRAIAVQNLIPVTNTIGLAPKRRLSSIESERQKNDFTITSAKNSECFYSLKSLESRFSRKAMVATRDSTFQSTKLFRNF